MGASTTQGTGTASAEGPLRGYDLDNIRRVYINQSGNLLPCIYIIGSAGSEKYVLRAVSDGQVKIDSTDIPGYLGNKILPGTNITFVTSVGPNKTITINSTGGGGGGIPIVVDLGVIGPTFSPAELAETTVIKGVVNEPLIMSDITITDGVSDKMLIRVELTQGATGGDVSSWSANFVGSDLIPLTSVGLSVGVGKTDILVFEWDDARVQWMLVGFINGVLP